LSLARQCPAKKFACDPAPDDQVLKVLNAHNGAPFFPMV
jgi:hypothetical protein